MPWFKLINLFLTAITQWVFERAKCDQISGFALCRNNRSQNLKRGAVSCWGLSPGGIQDLFRGKQRSPQVSPPGGGWKLCGHRPLTGVWQNKQHLQLLCPNELNILVFSPPQGGIQQGTAEAIPCTCYWWSPDREGGGKCSLSSLRTSETQFSNVSHERDLTESLAGTGTHYLP